MRLQPGKEAEKRILHFGITISERGPQAQPDQVTAIAGRAEAMGFYALEMGDHIVIPGEIRSPYPYTSDNKVPVWNEWNEQLTTLAFLAGRTTSIHLVTSVLVLPYRNPLLAAKMLSTIDVLSKGRLIVGVGAGWMREEFQALRAPPFDERGDVAEEYIRLFKSLWTEEPTPSYRGKYFSLEPHMKFLPKPAQSPHPPIWVGGESPFAMKRAAALGDAWYPIGSNPRYPLKTLAQLVEATQRLHRYRAEAEREQSEVDLALVAPQFSMEDSDVAGNGSKNRESSSSELFVGNPEKIVSDVKACEKLGFSYISFDLTGVGLEETLRNIDDFAEKVLRPSR